MSEGQPSVDYNKFPVTIEELKTKREFYMKQHEENIQLITNALIVQVQNAAEKWLSKNHLHNTEVEVSWNDRCERTEIYEEVIDRVIEWGSDIPYLKLTNGICRKVTDNDPRGKNEFMYNEYKITVKLSADAVFASLK